MSGKQPSATIATPTRPSPAQRLADYIGTLFSTEHFPNGVPEPNQATHKWGPRQAGQVGAILDQLGQLRTDHLGDADRLRRLELKSTLQTAFNRWQGGPWNPGSEPELAVRNVAELYHLLRKDTADVGPSPPLSAGPRPPLSPTLAREFGKWTVVRRIDGGGQGDVYEVEAKGEPHRALKKFRFGKGERGKQARERFKREVEALRSLNEPGFLRLHEADESAGWMVTTLYPSTLERQRDRFRGNVLAALTALRPIVTALAALHKSGAVHRDVKPANIFVDQDGSLVLGDFGIVFFKDADGERLTETYERVGSRYWMPPWADIPSRIVEVKPTADVFGMGKVLWVMLSGDEVLPLWYFDRPENDLEKRFPEDTDMRWANEILTVSVVQEDGAGVQDCGELLKRFDRAIGALRLGGTVLREGRSFPCRVCGLGRYRHLHDGELRQVASITPTTAARYSNVVSMFSGGNALTVKLHACDNCGHLMTFFYADGGRPVGWQPKPKP